MKEIDLGLYLVEMSEDFGRSESHVFSIYRNGLFSRRSEKSTSCEMVCLSEQPSGTLMYGELGKKIGGIIRDLCRQKRIKLHEGHAMPDHIHLLLSIPPKFSPFRGFPYDNAAFEGASSYHVLGAWLVIFFAMNPGPSGQLLFAQFAGDSILVRAVHHGLDD